MFHNKDLSLFIKTSQVALMCLSLSGCLEEESPKKEKTLEPVNRLNVEPKISDFLHSFVPKPLPTIETPESQENVEVPEEIEEVSQYEIGDLYDDTIFGDEAGALQPFKTKDEQSKRYESLLKRRTTSVVKSGKSIIKKRINARDKDYKTHLKDIKEDISSYPVDGSRVITADRYIPVVLENSINSQLPGRFIGIVDEHVFANEGRGVLLPKGTRIICTYESLAKEGDTRLAASCPRAIRPDGASILLTNAYTADQMARTGAIGKVDNRMWEKYGSAFIVAGISALAAAGANTSVNSPVYQSANNLSVNLGQITAQMLEANVDLAPVMTVAAGSRLQIIPMTDIWIREPEEVEDVKESEISHKAREKAVEKKIS